jgi:protein-S-isoprenylcysteine O-methyltransferase Ste14
VRKQPGPEAICYPPLIALVFLLGAWLLEKLLALSWFDASWLKPAGVLLFVAGGALDIWCVRLFTKAHTNISPMKPALVLVREGPYRFSRNPIYVGLSIAYFGAALFFGLEWALPLFVVFALVMHFGVVRPEEIHLHRQFGEAYDSYVEKVRRYF